MIAIFAIVKRLLASNKISFIITALVVLCATSSGDVVLSNGNYSWLLAVFTPFFFVFYDFFFTWKVTVLDFPAVISSKLIVRVLVPSLYE